MPRRWLILVGAMSVSGCVNVTIDPTKPIEVHAVVDVNVKAVDKKTTDVFGESVENAAVPAQPAVNPAQPVGNPANPPKPAADPTKPADPAKP